MGSLRGMWSNGRRRTDLESKSIKLFKQCAKPGLLEMTVAGERVWNSSIRHCDKRNAVSERPFLVGSLPEQINATVKQLRTRSDNSDVRGTFRVSSNSKKAERFSGMENASATSVRTHAVVTSDGEEAPNCVALSWAASRSLSKARK